MEKDTSGDFTLQATQGDSGFNYWVQGVGNLYPDDKCNDDKLKTIAMANKFKIALEKIRNCKQSDYVKYIQEVDTIACEVLAQYDELDI